MTYDTFKPIVTDQDCDRLDSLLDTLGCSANGLLETELNRARVVPKLVIPPDVVTMNSVVTFVDETTDKPMQIALVYPSNADASKGRISILAPLGAALLGLKVGQSFKVPQPNGKTKHIRVTSVDFQPEAFGAYDL